MRNHESDQIILRKTSLDAQASLQCTYEHKFTDWAAGSNPSITWPSTGEVRGEQEQYIMPLHCCVGWKWTHCAYSICTRMYTNCHLPTGRSAMLIRTGWECKARPSSHITTYRLVKIIGAFWDDIHILKCQNFFMRDRASKLPSHSLYIFIQRNYVVYYTMQVSNVWFYLQCVI